jgi:DNA-binding NarL/FixJ family response regulator
VHWVRVLFGVLPAGLQAAVSEAVAQEPDIDVVGVAATPTELLLAAGTLRADVAVIAAADDELPGVATHLLDQYPDIRVVAVAPEADAALLYSLRPRLDRFSGSPLELAKAIRAACHEAA